MSRRRWLELLACGAGLLALSWGVVSLIGSAWTACADIEAGGRFTLLFGYLPGTFAATVAVTAIAANLTRRMGSAARVAVIVGSVLLVSLAITMWSVPHADYGDWPGGPGDEATVQCGPGGIPTWWPIWLPS
jgi:hypothetical protein